MLPPRPAVLRRRFCLMAFCLADEEPYGDTLSCVEWLARGVLVGLVLVVSEVPTTHRSSSPRRRGSSTPRPIGSITAVSGILDHPPSRVMTAEDDTPSRSRG